MKFKRENAQLQWHVFFGLMTNIRAYSQVPNDDFMYVCGDFNEDEDEQKDDDATSYSAGIARMRYDGEISWFI